MLTLINKFEVLDLVSVVRRPVNSVGAAIEGAR